MSGERSALSGAVWFTASSDPVCKLPLPVRPPASTWHTPKLGGFDLEWACVKRVDSAFNVTFTPLLSHSCQGWKGWERGGEGGWPWLRLKGTGISSKYFNWANNAFQYLWTVTGILFKNSHTISLWYDVLFILEVKRWIKTKYKRYWGIRSDYGCLVCSAFFNFLSFLPYFYVFWFCLVFNAGFQHRFSTPVYNR